MMTLLYAPRSTVARIWLKVLFAIKLTFKHGSNFDYFICYFTLKDESLLVRSFFKEVCL